MLLMILMDLVSMSRRLPFEDERRNVTHVVTYDWWCVIRW